MNRVMVFVGVLVIGFGVSNFFSYKAGGDAYKAASAAKTIESVAKARKDEQALQEKVNEQAQEQLNAVLDINIDLHANLDRVRLRANRRDLQSDTNDQCKGSTGADLSAQDSGFLVREAARADILRAALRLCYKYADTVGGK